MRFHTYLASQTWWVQLRISQTSPQLMKITVSALSFINARLSTACKTSPACPWTPPPLLEPRLLTLRPSQGSLPKLLPFSAIHCLSVSKFQFLLLQLSTLPFQTRNGTIQVMIFSGTQKINKKINLGWYSAWGVCKRLLFWILWGKEKAYLQDVFEQIHTFLTLFWFQHLLIFLETQLHCQNNHLWCYFLNMNSTTYPII